MITERLSDQYEKILAERNEAWGRIKDLEAQLKQQEGHTLVPDEPTEAMLLAGAEPIEYISIAPKLQAKGVYKAMLKAQGVNDND